MLRASAACVLLVVFCGVSVSAAGNSEKDFGIVIDAGSTGSRAHVYSWARRRFTKVPADLSVPVAEEKGAGSRVKPGISSPGGVAVLDQLIAFLKINSTIADSPERWSSIPIFLKATAGMRTLPEKERNAIMTAVRHKLANSGFQWVSHGQARVISGEEEGVFGWISVNWLMGKLKAGEPQQLEGTFGALDLGGASTQITFKPMDPDILSNLFNLQLGKQVNENLYTHSYLYFGINEAKRRINQLVQLNASTGGVAPATADNPCYNSGYSFVYVDLTSGQETNFTGTGSFVDCNLFAAAIMGKDAVCLTDPAPQQSAVTAKQLHRVRSAVGAGDETPWLSDEEARLLAAELPPAPQVNPNESTCAIEGVYQPDTKGVTFIGFSAMSYLWQFLRLPYNSSTPGDLRDKATDFCAEGWGQVKKENPGVPDEFLDGYCIMSSYLYSLLTVGYGFEDSSTNVKVADPNAPIEFGWALGSIFFDANAELYSLAEESKKRYFAAFLASVIAAGALVCVLLFVVLFFVIPARRRQLSVRTSMSVQDPFLQDEMGNRGHAAGL